MVHRIYVEKRPGLSPEAGNLLADLRDFLGIRSLAGVRVLNRYDVENIDPQVYERAKTVVFSEPQADVIWDETFPQPRNAHSLLAVEALPGQFDQRADSCAQCIQLMAGVERPRVRHAKVYLLEGRLSQEELDKIRGYLINPVESREASLEKPETLARDYAAPAMVETLTGFTALGGFSSFAGFAGFSALGEFASFAFSCTAAFSGFASFAGFSALDLEARLRAGFCSGSLTASSRATDDSKSSPSSTSSRTVRRTTTGLPPRIPKNPLLPSSRMSILTSAKETPSFSRPWVTASSMVLALDSTDLISTFPPLRSQPGFRPSSQTSCSSPGPAPTQTRC